MTLFIKIRRQVVGIRMVTTKLFILHTNIFNYINIINSMFDTMYFITYLVGPNNLSHDFYKPIQPCFLRKVYKEQTL